MCPGGVRAGQIIDQRPNVLASGIALEPFEFLQLCLLHAGGCLGVLDPSVQEAQLHLVFLASACLGEFRRLMRPVG